MFKQVRRQDRVMNNDRMTEVIRNGDYGILSTCSQNGYAYGVPLNYVVMNEAIYFHCALEGHKLENIENNNKVSFCVVGVAKTLPEHFSTQYDSVIVFGKAYEVFEEEKKEAFVAILQKFAGEHMVKGLEYMKNASHKTKVIKIEIEHMTGKSRGPA